MKTWYLASALALCFLSANSSLYFKLQQQLNSTSASGGLQVHGRVVSCWQGQAVPVKQTTVYALTMGESLKIREVIRKIHEYESSHPLGKNDAPGTPFDQDLIREVKALPPTAYRTTTSDNGEYSFHGLRTGQKYLILVINTEEENGLYYVEKESELTDVRDKTINFGSEKDCRPQS